MLRYIGILDIGLSLDPDHDHEKSTFLAVQNRTKLRINDIYIYVKSFPKFGEKIRSQKKVIKVQS